MKWNTATLLNELEAICKENLHLLDTLSSTDSSKLIQRKAAQSWNALECVQHLIYYSDFYLPELQNRINTSSYSPQATFQSGLLGNYFAKSMLPGAKSMKTFKEMNPIQQPMDSAILDVFRSQLNTTIAILKQCQNINLEKTKTTVSISKLIKLRLGDTLRIVIYHNDRHLRQALSAIQ